MKVYNVMSFNRYDGYCEYDCREEGCYLKKKDAIKQKNAVVRRFKYEYEDEIKRYKNKKEYPVGSEGAFDSINNNTYFEMKFGSDEYFRMIQVWIDELNVVE